MFPIKSLVQVSFESNITVTEGVDSSAVVTLKTNNIHPPRTAFNVTVVANATRGNATRGCYLYVYIFLWDINFMSAPYLAFYVHEALSSLQICQ